MKNSKFLEIIRSFSENEKSEFRLFLDSPYFMRNGAVEMNRLFNFLLEKTADSEQKMPAKEVLHSATFPDIGFSLTRINRALARFGELLEQFLLTLNYQGEDVRQKRMLDLSGIFFRRNLFGMFEDQLNVLKKEAAAADLESTENFWFKYKAAFEEHVQKSLFNKEKGNLHIPETVQFLDLFYLNERTELINRLLLQVRTTALDTRAQYQMLQRTPDYVAHYERESTLLQIRCRIERMLSQKEPNKKDMAALLELIQANEHKLSSESTGDMFTYLRNYCTIMVNKGHIDLQVLLHEIQKDNLKKGYFFNNGKISHFAMMNIVLVALFLKKTAWAKQFVVEYKHLIMTDDEPYAALMMAWCLFEEKKYEEALDYISFGFKPPTYSLLARRLELKIYYELKSDLLPFKIDAFRKFLQRNAQKKFSDGIWPKTSRFVNFVQRLSLLAPKDTKRIQRVLQQINETESHKIVERPWLLEKIRELL